ncbi:MAG: TIGR00730 family Rossman fold protein [Chloroflexota bacterium]
MTKIVAVFGSARVKPNTDVYQQSYDVGQALAEAGYVTMTGGYDGVMAAASQGASDASGAVQGITVAELKYIGESRVNQWVTEEIRYETLHERILHLVKTADAHVVMPGGLGTAQELIEVWQGMRLGDYPVKPLILYGTFWDAMIDSMLQVGYISEHDMRLITTVHDTKTLLDTLTDAFETKD